MSIFTEANEDAYSVAPDTVAEGPKVGFLDAFNTSWDAQMRTASQFGIESALQEEEDRQARILWDAGIRDIPKLYDPDERSVIGGVFDFASAIFPPIRQAEFALGQSGDYLDVARNALGEEVGSNSLARIEAYDKKIEELRKARPDLRLYTSKDMFSVVRTKAQDVEQREQTMRTGWGGFLGSLAGGGLASFNPKTDPLNYFTLPIGGVGKTAGMRIATEVGAQGAIEAVNQVTGVQTERRMLGLGHGFADAASRIAFTAGAGGALAAVGEGAGRLASRWFRGTDADPAPAPADVGAAPEPLALPHPDQFKEAAGAARIEADPRAALDYMLGDAPLSGIRAGKSRSITDVNSATRMLDEWDGPAPAMMRPQTATAAFETPSITARLDTRAAVDNANLYSAAKAVDPKAFAQLEKLTTKRDTYRQWLTSMTDEKNGRLAATIDEIDTRIAALETRHRTTQGKTNKLRIREQIAELKADRDTATKALAASDTPDMAVVRRSLMEKDEQMRDLAPMLGRAYAQARGKWGADADEIDAVWNAYRAGKLQAEMPPSPNRIPDYDAVAALVDRAPILTKANEVEPKATSAETASEILAAEAKVLDEALEATRAEFKRVLGKEADGKLRVGDHEFDLKDTVWVEREDGTLHEVSVRELLEHNRETEYELEAISTCSMQPRS